MAYTKLGPFVDGGAPYLSAATLNAFDAGILAGSYTSAVYPEAYVQTGDGGDWTLAISRALAYATPLGLPVVLQKIYPCKTTLTLNSGDDLTGFGPATGIQGPANAPVILLQATSMNGITLSNFLVDGNAVTLASAASVRTVQFISCTNVIVQGLTVRNSPDWGLTFKLCSQVAVFNHVHDIGADNLSGSRDGVHFLDCTDALLDGAYIHSGDDCVGITSQTIDIARITIRNVFGYSDIASVVTVGNESTTTHSASDIHIENITTYYPAGKSGTPTPYLVKVRAQNGSLVQRVRIANVSGRASSHAVWLEGNSTNWMVDVEVYGLNVTSTTNHGVLFDHVQHFELRSARGKSTAGAYDGVNLTSCLYGAVSGAARTCAMWGLQLNGCTSIDVAGFIARDNGSVNFASNTGGNATIVNCTDVQVIGGQFVGSSSTSYYGLLQSGNTSTVISTATRVGGAH